MKRRRARDGGEVSEGKGTLKPREGSMATATAVKNINCQGGKAQNET